MILCLCEGLNHRVIEDAVRQGCTSVRAVARRTGAGTGCGSCVCDVRRILERSRAADGGEGPPPAK